MDLIFSYLSDISYKCKESTPLYWFWPFWQFHSQSKTETTSLQSMMESLTQSPATSPIHGLETNATKPAKIKEEKSVVSLRNNAAKIAH